MFLAFANDRGHARDGYLRELPQEEREIRRAIDATDWCELVVRSNATLAEIVDVFQDHRYRHRIAVFHYGGHANSYQLLVESERSETQPLHMQGLAPMLGKQRGLQLVFLNGCSTGRQAHDLLQAGVPAVIATSHAIDDQVARAFAARFYDGLARGHTIEEAYRSATEERAAALGSRERAFREFAVPAASGSGWPWGLFPEGDGLEPHQWDLPSAFGDPTSGLPPVPRGDLPEAPFINLHWFARNDAEIFFGRGRQVRALYDRLTDEDGAPVILLYGQSGVGKSSLLEAGLRPRLEHSHEVRYARRDQGAGLLGTLEQALGARAAPLSAAWNTLEAQLDRPVVVILDQLEEVFTRPNEAQPDELNLLLEALETLLGDRSERPRGKLVLCFRKEWLAEVERPLVAMALPHVKVFLEPLDRHGIVEAIEGPTRSVRLQRHYGLDVEPDLAGVIAADLLKDRDAPIAPTLQILLTKMWAEAKRISSSAPRFTSDLYRALKAEGILLGDFLDQQLDVMRAWRAPTVDSGLALDVLAFHTTPLGTAEQRTAEALGAAYREHEDLAGLIQKAKDLYLLVDPAGDRPGLTDTRLAHDTLAPLVRRRFDESDRPGQRARRILESRAVDWQGSRQGAPLDGHDLSEVEKGAIGMRVRTPAESRLVRSSRRRRRGRRVWWGFGVGVALALVGGIVSFWNEASLQRGSALAEREHAVVQTRIASARQLVSQADAIVSRGAVDRDRALLLAIEAAHEFREAGIHSLEVDQVLRRTIERMPHHAHRLWHASVPTSLMFAASGQLVVATELDHAVSVWDPERGVEHRRLALDVGDIVRTATSSHDGRYLVTGSERGTVTLWDLEHDTHHRFSPGHDAPVVAAAFSTDGSLLVTGSERGVHVAALHPHRPPVELDGVGAITSVDVSPDGAIVAAGSRDAIVRLWDLDAPSDPTELRHDGAVHTIAFLDARHLVTLDAVGTVSVWDTAGARRVASLSHGSDDAIRIMVLSNDRRSMATAGVDGTARIWAWTDATYREVARVAHDDTIVALSFSADGRHVATASDDRTGRVWDLETGSEVYRLSHRQPVVAVALSPDAARIASSSLHGFVHVWEAPDLVRRPVVPGSDTDLGATTFVYDGAFAINRGSDDSLVVWNAADGRRVDCCRTHERPIVAWTTGRDDPLVASLTNGEIRLWDVRTSYQGAVPGVERARAIALSPDGRRLLAADDAGTIRAWDVTNALDLRETTDVLDHDGFHVGSIGALTFSADGRYALSTSGGVDAFRALDDLDVFGSLGLEGAVDADDWILDDTIVDLPGRVVVWEVASWRDALRIDHGASVQAARFSPDASHVVTAGRDGQLHVWDVGAERRVATMTHSQVDDFAFSSAGRLLASWGRGSDVRVWAVDSGRRVNRGAILHGGDVREVAFSADERHLAIASRDAVRMWDVESGTEIVRFEHHTPIVHVRFGAADASVVTVSMDGSVQQTAWRPDDLVAHGCARLGRSLTWAEWEQYLGDEPYRATCHGSALDAIEVFEQALHHHHAGDSAAASRAVEASVALALASRVGSHGNDICRFGSVNGYASVVLPACDHAVALRPDDGDYRDSRGIARGLNGDYHGAAEDFEFYVDWGTRLRRSDATLDERRAWIDDLRRQESPFDDAVLASLRAERR